MRDKRVVITGGSGFVGRYLVEELKNRWLGSRIVVWDRVLAGLPEGVLGIEVDITKPDTYKKSLEKEQPDFLVHLAAVSGVSQARGTSEIAFEVNVEGTKQILEEIEKISPENKVLAVSSVDVYGSAVVRKEGRGSPPLSAWPELSLEEAKPVNEYARSKWEMERMIRENFEDRVLRVRPFPHIGPGQGRGFVTADFASQIAAIEQGRQEPVLRVGNLDSKRDFTDVRDVVRAYRLLMEMDWNKVSCSKLEQKRGVCRVYNVCSGKGVSIKKVLDSLLSLSEVEVEVREHQELIRKSDVTVLVGDCSKLKRDTGWQPRIGLRESLEDVLGWWRGQ